MEFYAIAVKINGLDFVRDRDANTSSRKLIIPMAENRDYYLCSKRENTKHTVTRGNNSWT